MTGRVSLPMYDLPGLQPVWDAWWRVLHRAMAVDDEIRLESELTRLPDLMAHWTDPGMLLSQTCGYPYTLGLERDWRLIATPVYDVDWCEGPNYRNLVLVRDDDPAKDLGDLRGRTVAFNSVDSHSGYNSIRAMIAPMAEKGSFFGGAVQSGSHFASIEAVVAGKADCCSVDCVTYALIAKHSIAQVEGLRVLALGPLVPGLPFVAPRSLPNDVSEALRAALLNAVNAPALAELNSSLLFKGFVALPEDAYDTIRVLEKKAVDAGYPALA